MKLSDKIYTCRTRAKLSQEELAERLGVSRQAVSRWECGDNVPEPGKLLMLARVFGVTADWLLDDEQGVAEPHGLDDEPPTPPPPPSIATRTVLIPPPRRRSELTGGIILLCVGLACLAFFGVVMLIGMRLTGARVLNIFIFPLALIALGSGIGSVIFGVVYIVRGLRRKNQENR